MIRGRADIRCPLCLTCTDIWNSTSGPTSQPTNQPQIAIQKASRKFILRISGTKWHKLFFLEKRNRLVLHFCKTKVFSIEDWWLWNEECKRPNPNPPGMLKQGSTRTIYTVWFSSHWREQNQAKLLHALPEKKRKWEKSWRRPQTYEEGKGAEGKSARRSIFLCFEFDPRMRSKTYTPKPFLINWSSSNLILPKYCICARG